MLTATEQSKNGYWIDSLKIHLYSIEEINYYIYNHINLIYRDFFSNELFDFIENELGQVHMAEDMRRIADNNGSTADFVRYFLNESYYYNGQELSEISHIVAHLDDMGRAERMKIQGDAFYNSKKYYSALECYLDILKNMEQDGASSMFYGRIAYTVGTIYAKMFMTKSANAYFSMAYDLSPDPLYAKACVYLSIISGDDEELLSSIVRYKISDDALDSMRMRVKATRRELKGADESAEFSRELRNPEVASELVKNWKNEYYTMLK